MHEESEALAIHDFVGLDATLDIVISALRSVAGPSLIGRLVCDAWQAERRALDDAVPSDAGRPAGSPSAPRPVVILGRPRLRNEAVIIPLSWMSSPGPGPWLPPLDADLEIVAFGRRRTHLHVLGTSKLPPGQMPRSSEASMSQRFTVALVRHVLNSLADEIRRPVPISDHPIVLAIA